MSDAVGKCVATVILTATVVLGACEGDGEDPPAPGAGEAAESPQADASDAGETVDPSIARIVDRILPEGASGTLVAARDGDLVHCAGFGMADREGRVPSTCDTAYDVMSMTKQFTAAAILRLEMMGELHVSDPIGEYFGQVPADKRAITLHQLLTHTAGLVGSLGGDYVPLSRDAMIAKALGSRLLSPPGGEYHYSNVGYSLLAAIVEQASGVGYERFLGENLFEPAAMTSTGYVRPTWRPGQVAVEYDSRGVPQGRPFEHPWTADGPYWNLRGNGGLLSTARDMFRWHRALEGDEILDRPAKAKLFEPYVLENPGGSSWYGYGWTIQRSEYGTIAWHDGGNAWSYGELIRLLDRGVLVFWVTNQSRDETTGSNLMRLSPELPRGVVERLLAD